MESKESKRVKREERGKKKRGWNKKNRREKAAKNRGEINNMEKRRSKARASGGVSWLLGQ